MDAPVRSGPVYRFGAPDCLQGGAVVRVEAGGVDRLRVIGVVFECFPATHYREFDAAPIQIGAEAVFILLAPNVGQIGEFVASGVEPLAGPEPAAGLGISGVAGTEADFALWQQG